MTQRTFGTLPRTGDADAAGDERMAALVEGLRLLAARAGVVASELTRRRALETASAEAFADWSDRLAAAADALSIKATAVRMPLRSLARADRELFPLFTLSTTGRPVTVEAAAAERIAQAIGIREDEPWVFMAAEPSAPLQAMSQPGGHPTPQRRLLGLLRLEAEDLRVVVVYAAAVGLLALGVPIGVQTVVNTIAFVALVQPLIVLTVIVLAVVALAAALRALEVWVVERVQQRIFVRASLDLARRLPRIEAAELRQKNGPELVNRFFDVVTIQKGAAALLLDGLSVALQTAVGMVVLAFYHPLFLAFAVALAGVVAFVVFGLGHGGTSSAVEESKAKYSVAAWLEQLATHELAFRSTPGERYGTERAEDLAFEWLRARRRHFRVLFRQVAGALVLQVLASVVVLGLGGWLVIRRQLTLGQLVAAELIVTSVVSAFTKLGKHFESYYDLVAALEKLGHVIDLPTERRAGGPAREVRVGAITIRDLDATSPPSSRGVEQVTLDIGPGGRAAILASDEHAARAIVDSLVGFARVRRGVTQIDGADTRELSPRSLRDLVAVVREPEIFPATVAENVLLGRTSLDADAVRRALERASLLDVVAQLPKGLESVLLPRGPELSRSEAARVTIARAIALEPSVLVLDGVLDSLSPELRRALLSDLGGEAAPWTLLVVTREPLVAAALRDVFVAADGHIRPARPADLEGGR